MVFSDIYVTVNVVVLRLLVSTEVMTGNKLTAWFNCFLIKELNITVNMRNQ